MQNKTLLYWILNKDKKPQYINAQGHIQSADEVTTTTGKPAHLEESPVEWTDTKVSFIRNPAKLGLFREFSIGLKFVKNSAKILRWIKWNIGMEAIYFLSIQKLNRLIFPDNYDNWYTGELDFSKFKQTFTGVEIMMVEGGLSKLLKAYEGTTYEIDLSTDPNRFSVYLDGLTFENKIDFTIYEQDPINTGFIGGGGFWHIGTGIISNEGSSQGIIVQDQALKAYPPYDLNNYFTKSVTKTLTVNITEGYISFTALAHDSRFALSIQKTDSAGNILTTYEIVPNQSIAQNSIHTINFSFNIPLLPNESITLNARTDTTGVVDNGFIHIISGSFKMDYLVRFDPTLCEAMTWYNLFEKLTLKLTNGQYGVKSDFLRSLDGTQCVSCGQAIREYKSVLHPAIIKTSMNDFLQACRRWGVGMSIEDNKLVIEPHSYFFRNSKSIHLGEIVDLEISDAEDLVCNTVKVGYANQTYDNVNGKDEFNVTQQYTTPITRITKELDLVCPYRADMFGIELTRLKLFGKDTTDNSADNDTFIMNVVKGTTYDYYRGPFETQINTGNYFLLIPTVLFTLPIGTIINLNSTNYTIINTSYVISGSTFIQLQEAVTNSTYTGSISTYDAEVYHLNRPAYSMITGLINPDEAFNIELSPKKILLNNAAYLHSILDMQDSGKVVFQSGEKNSKLSRTLNGVTTTEDADLNIFDLPEKLFKPYYFKFKTRVPVNMPQLMKTNPYDQVSFDYKGNKYYGFIWNASIVPATDDSQEWQLLCSPENDMTKLV